MTLIAQHTIQKHYILCNFQHRQTLNRKKCISEVLIIGRSDVTG